MEAFVSRARALADRGAKIAALRAKDGKRLGKGSREQLAALTAALTETAEALDEICADPEGAARGPPPRA